MPRVSRSSTTSTELTDLRCISSRICAAEASVATSHTVRVINSEIGFLFISIGCVILFMFAPGPGKAAPEGEREVSAAAAGKSNKPRKAAP